MQKQRKIPLHTNRNTKILMSGCRYSSRCSFAQDICSTVKPELRLFEGSQVACHFAEQIEEDLVKRP